MNELKRELESEVESFARKSH